MLSKLKARMGFNPRQEKPITNTDNIFIITSHGQTATRWLSSILNMNPDIFCSHGYTHPPSATENRDLTNSEIEALTKKANERFWNLSLNEYINELNSIVHKKYIGSVHAYMYGYLLEKMKSENHLYLKNKLVIINMVRHPITRIQSAYKCWLPENLSDIKESFVQTDFDNRCQFIINGIRKCKKLYSVSDKFFIVALLQSVDIAKDIELASRHKTKQIRFEDITSNPRSVSDLIYDLSRQTIRIAIEEASNLLNTKKINEHNTGSKLKDACNIFMDWEPWKKAAYLYIHRSQKFEKVYSNFGYDFSFLDQN